MSRPRVGGPAFGVGVTAASTAKLHPHPDVRYVPIADAPLLDLLLAWPRRDPHHRALGLRTVARLPR